MSQDQLLAYCKEMRGLEDEKEEAEAEVSRINKLLDELRLKKIPELMVSMEVKTCTFAGLGRVQLANDVYASTREGMKDKGIQWLRDCGYGGMISETYNSSSIKALFRRMLKDGVEIPEEIFAVTPFTRASIVKA